MDAFLGKLEGRLVDWVTAVAPWLAPIAPAYLVGVGVREVLEMPWVVAVVVALAVEFVGLGAIHTALQFWAWNTNHRGAKGEHAPVWVAGLAAGFYLMVVLGVTVVVELWPGATVVIKGFLALFTVPAALVVGLRAGQRRREEMAMAARVARREARRGGQKVTAGAVSGQGSVNGQLTGDRVNGMNGVSDRSDRSERKVEALRLVGEGKSYRQVGEAVGRSKAWVVGVVREHRENGR